MTILDAAIAVLIGTTARDVLQQGYYELKYRLHKRKPNQYQFLLDMDDKEED